MAKVEKTGAVHQLRLNVTDDINSMICRYLDFDNFLQILDGKFYVSAKSRFTDKYDAGKFIPKCYLFSIVPASGTPKLIPFEEERLKNLRDNVNRSRKYLASCWTKVEDDYLMWKTYTSGNCGVCVVSTINNVVASFATLNGYNAYCSKMFYDGFSYNDEPLDYLFSKSKGYSSEHEVRFYFIDEDKETSNAETDNIGKDFELFEVSPSVMIDRVIISPFIRGGSFELLKRILEKEYPFLDGKIKHSQIFDK